MPCGTSLSDPRGALARQIIVAAAKGDWKGLLGLAGGAFAQDILKQGSCGDFQACPSSQGLLDGGILEAGVPLCIVQPELCIAGGILLTAYAIYEFGPGLIHSIHFSKGGTQNVAHDYVRDMARALGGTTAVH
jgi:hypothetical protein